MAICGNCGTETSRLRTTIYEDGTRDECPNCSPQTFEKVTAPSDKKIWIGPEYAPNDYEKRYDSEGVYYMPKPEVTAEREAKIFKDSESDGKYAAAIETKRKHRRTQPMDELEIAAALNKVERLFKPLIEDNDTAYEV